MLNPDLGPLRSQWITIEHGSLADLLVLRGELEANGIPVDIPEMTIGTMDPFVRGGNAFDYRLCVPNGAVAQARALLERWQPDSLAAAERLEHGQHVSPGSPAAEAAVENPELESLRRRVRWMRWSVISTLFAPYCLVLAPGYLSSPLRRALTPRERWMTAAALVIAVFMTLVLLVALWLYGAGLLQLLGGET